MNCEKDVTDRFNYRIETINKSIKRIDKEVNASNIYIEMLQAFTTKYSQELSEELKYIINKLLCSNSVITEQIYLININEVKEIIKSKSGNFIELSKIVRAETSSSSSSSSTEISHRRASSPEISNQTASSPSNLNQTTTTPEKTDTQKKINYVKVSLTQDNTNNSSNILPKITKNNSFKITDETPNVPNDHNDILNQSINTIEFNAYNYKKEELYYIVYRIFCENVDLDRIEVDHKKLKKFIYQISLCYYNNPYHNFIHAVCVLQFAHLLMNKINVKNCMSPYEILGILIASLVHDVGHPGYTNNFEVNNKSHLALKYNDKSVLENHHCSLTFYILQLKETNLLHNFSRENFTLTRNMIIECVLATDMKHHNDLLHFFSFQTPTIYSNHSNYDITDIMGYVHCFQTLLS